MEPNPLLPIYDLHDRIVRELLETKSLAALIWLIGQGRELEFRAGGQPCFLTRDHSLRVVSLWVGQKEHSFDSVEELIARASIQGTPFPEAWEQAQLETLF